MGLAVSVGVGVGCAVGVGGLVAVAVGVSAEQVKTALFPDTVQADASAKNSPAPPDVPSL